MSAMKRLFQVMADKKASDIFMSVGAPINIKINGVAVRVNQAIMTAATVGQLPGERVPPEGRPRRGGALHPEPHSGPRHAGSARGGEGRDHAEARADPH